MLCAAGATVRNAGETDILALLDTGKILVFDASGAPLWSKDTMAPDPYGTSFSGRMAVVAFATGDLFRDGKREVVSLSIEAQGWYPSRLCIFDSAGTLRASYWQAGHLQKVIIGAATARRRTHHRRGRE
jgi:hypothetical protein